jgi:hypothetical protein
MASQDNPLVARLGRAGRGLSVRAAAWAGLGLGLAGLALCVWNLFRPLRTDLPLFIELIAWLALLVLPPVVGSVAARITAADRASEAYALMRLTSLSDRDIVRGYVVAALLRMRLALAAALAAFPAAAVGLIHVTLEITAVFCTIMYGSLMYYVGTAPTCLPWPALGTPLMMLAVAPLALAPWGMILLAAVLGVGLALWTRRAVWAALGASLLSLAVGLLVLIIAFDRTGGGWVVLSSAPEQIPAPGVGTIVPKSLLALLALAAPPLLALFVLRLARRWV